MATPEKLLESIAETISVFCPFLPRDVYVAIKATGSVDKALRAIDYCALSGVADLRVGVQKVQYEDWRDAP